MKYYGFLLLLSLTITISAQNSTLRGVVYDQNTNEALPFTNVGMPDKGIGVITNSEGYFQLSTKDCQATDSIYFSYIGYEMKALTINSVKDSPQIALTPIAIELESVVIHPNNLSAEDMIDSMKFYYKKTHCDSSVIQRCFLHTESHTIFNTLEVELNKSSVDGFNDNLFNKFNASVPEETYTYKEVLFDTYGKGFKDFKYDLVEGIKMNDNWDIETNLEDEIDALDTTFFDNDNRLKVRSGIIPIPTGYKQRQKRDEERAEKKANEKERISHMDSVQLLAYKDSIKSKREENKLEEGQSYAKREKQRIKRMVGKIKMRIVGDNRKDWDFLHKYGKYQYHFSGYTIIDESPATIISFTPKGGGDFEGKIIISDTDYALIQLEYKYHDGKDGLSIKLPGLSVRESVNTGFIAFEKGTEGYYLKFLNHHQAHEVEGKRPLSFKEKEKKDGNKRRIIKGEITFDTHNSDIEQLLVISRDSTTQQRVEDFVAPKGITIEKIKEYDPHRWDKYDIIPPSENLKKYKKQFE